MVKRCTIFNSDEYNSKALNDNIFVFGTYQKEYFGRNKNPYYDELSASIKEVKRVGKENIEYDTEKFRDIIGFFLMKFEYVLNLSDEYAICVIPSHEKGLQESGIRILAYTLAHASLASENFMCPEYIDSSRIVDGTSVLVRTKTIQKKTRGGKREPDYEMESLSVQNAELIKGKQVLLLDDVTKTGTSLKVGKELLLEAGAKLVVPFALGEAWKRRRMFGIELNAL